MKVTSLFFRLFFGVLLLVGVIVLLGGWISARVMTDRLEEIQRTDQRHTAQALRAVASQRFDFATPGVAAIDRWCKTVIGPALEEDRFTIIAADGEVLGDSAPVPAARMENHKTPDRPEVLGALAGRRAWDRRRSETLEVTFRYLALPVTDDQGQVLAVVRLARPSAAVVSSSRYLVRSLAWGGLSAVVAAALLGMLLSWMWYRPLRQITRSAGQIAAGQLTEPLAISGARELVQLARAINDMRDSLRNQMARIVDQQARLETVLRSLRDGIVATSPADQVVLLNEAARSMLLEPAQRAVGEHVQHVVRAAGVIDAYKKATTTGQVESARFETEYRGGRRTIDVLVLPVGQHAQSLGHVLVFRDVTDLLKTAAIKSEFVVNASHELRTPLATLRATVDAFLAGDAEDPHDRGRLVGILDRHVGRLEELVNDLLDFSAVEDPSREIACQPVRAAGLIDWVRSQFAARADEKGLTLELDPGPEEMEFHSDEGICELILRNLLENAVKFTPAGGTVRCAFSEEATGTRITVTDTGIGIPFRDQQRVFERFYQVDPSRSGDNRTRGSGLGLAIVKHAVGRLNGGVTLRSRPGQGTTVSVHLPHQGGHGG